MKSKPTTIDAYLSRLPDDQRQALQSLRETIQEAAPLAEEWISYQLPAFRQGRLLVAIGATRTHCAFYLMSSTVVESFAEKLTRYDTSKGTIRFSPDQPLPKSLVKKLVRARLAENARIE